MADYNLVMNTRVMPTRVPENPGPALEGPGPHVETTARLPGDWHNPGLVDEHMNMPDTHTLSVRMPESNNANSLTRVMSPSNPSNMVLEANQSLLLGLQCRCKVCNQMSPDPSLCANCGVFGHPICIQVEYFQGYAFCHGCMQMVVTQYAAMNDVHLRTEWQIALSRQVRSWRESARDAIGT